LELAHDPGNVSEACRRTGYSREQFYEIRGNYQTFGSEGLLDKISGPKNPHSSRAGEEQEQAVLDYCLELFVHGALKVSRQLILRGVTGLRNIRAALFWMNISGFKGGLRFTNPLRKCKLIWTTASARTTKAASFRDVR
jgi:hypothetical protein